MKPRLQFYILFVVSFHQFCLIERGDGCRGCLPLDSLTFDKMVRKFKFSLVKFDVPYPYGVQHKEFGKIALDGAEKDDFIVAVVGVKDNGDADNQDLAKRYGAEKENLPVIVFLKYDKAKNKTVDVVYPSSKEMKSDLIKKWIRKNSDLYLPVEGCLADYDVLVEKFMEASTIEKREEILLQAAERLSDFGRDEVEPIRKAKVYVKIMKKIITDGSIFVIEEMDRVRSVLKQKLSPAKRFEMEEKLNVLMVFDGDGESM